MKSQCACQWNSLDLFDPGHVVAMRIRFDLHSGEVVDLMDRNPLVHKAKCQHLNDARDVNRCKQLCDLPHAILLRILAFLPTEDAVRTSVLSRRWEYLWTSIPCLVFIEENIDGRMLFRNFVERALLLRDSSSLKAFSLTCKVDSEEYLDGNESRVNLWITAAIRRNVEDLRLHLKLGHGATVYMLPRCIFRCETLRELHLEMNHDLKLPSLVCLTNLKVLTLTGVQFRDDNSVEKLLSCPSLEKLSLYSCEWNLEVLEISAPNLLYLTIVEDVLASGIRNSQVRIHGACIKSFDYFGELFYDYVILSSSSLVEASIGCHHDETEKNIDQGACHLYKLLKAVSNVKQMFLSIEFLEDLDEREDILNLNSLPIFHSLTKLILDDCHVNLESRALLLLLSGCPILKSLEFSGSILVVSKNEDWTLDPMPPCLPLSLKEITIRCFQGTDLELLAVRILLRTAAVLEKMLIHCSRRCSRTFQGNLTEHLNELPTASNQCTIFVKAWAPGIL
ncbi:F-box/LRR-repeat protein At3g26922-like isoform X1 [Syzygium oleosum]|uniref:F-box/LRR-repeat protein At3g26922-like isoform X1 n=2 Tax=Syzygium oleosum TaxID=219896 RepID=UPI0024BB2EFB|nr:F-box/LRR-repeat protein At3g26922-like isoform X1 [Syzygium oleosum]